MSKPIVFLSGPITGWSYAGCTLWREYVKHNLEPLGVHCLSPMRAMRHLSGSLEIRDSYPGDVLACDRGIMVSDSWDCRRCDILFVNLLGTKRVSIGTVLEIGFAWENRIPVVLVIEKEGNIHDHSMIREATGFRVNTVDEGLLVVMSLLDLEHHD